MLPRRAALLQSPTRCPWSSHCRSVSRGLPGAGSMPGPRFLGMVPFKALFAIWEACWRRWCVLPTLPCFRVGETLPEENPEHPELQPGWDSESTLLLSSLDSGDITMVMSSPPRRDPCPWHRLVRAKGQGMDELLSHAALSACSE